jgi:CheY-like chemotaxis protein
VDTYNDPMLALQDFKAGLYDLLLIDFMMAKMSNYKLCDRIRQIDPEIRVCYMSGTYPSFEEVREVFPELQTHCFIPKPIEMNDLKKNKYRTGALSTDFLCLVRLLYSWNKRAPYDIIVIEGAEIFQRVEFCIHCWHEITCTNA